MPMRVMKGIFIIMDAEKHTVHSRKEFAFSYIMLFNRYRKYRRIKKKLSHDPHDNDFMLEE